MSIDIFGKCHIDAALIAFDSAFEKMQCSCVNMQRDLLLVFTGPHHARSRPLYPRSLTGVLLALTIFGQGTNKLITMEMLGRIRRMHLRDKLSLHEIAKRTGLSRNTVRSWLRTPECPQRKFPPERKPTIT